MSYGTYEVTEVLQAITGFDVEDMQLTFTIGLQKYNEEK